MPQCKNVPYKQYRGDENTPLGRGYSASGEKIGSRRVGLDGQKYMVVKWGKGKRWKKVVARAKNRRGFFDWAKGSNLDGYFTKKKTEFHDMPDEMLFQISEFLDCDGMLKFRASSKKNKKIVDANMANFYLVMRERYPDQFPRINLDDYTEEELVKKVISLCNDRQFKNMLRLLDAGSDSTNAIDGAKDLNDKQIENMVILLEAGADSYFAYEGARGLTDEQFSNMLILLKAGLDGESAYVGANYLNDRQFVNMLRLLEAGVDSTNALDGAKRLNDRQFNNMLILLKAGLDGEYAYVGAKYLNDKQFENMLRLLEAGVDSADAYDGAKRLNDEQIEHILRLLESGVDYSSAYHDVKKNS